MKKKTCEKCRHLLKRLTGGEGDFDHYNYVCRLGKKVDIVYYHNCPHYKPKWYRFWVKKEL